MKVEIFDLVRLADLPEESLPKAEAAVLLVIRGGVNFLLQSPSGADDLLVEQQALTTDKKAYMRGRVVNKLARHNLCFSDEAQEPDYEVGQGRVISFDTVPLLQTIRRRLPDFFGEQSRDLQCEGNYYYDITKCGIGFHGDGERRIVVAARLGESIPLHYQWFHHSSPIGSRIVIKPSLQHGDMYCMSSKAVGTDWRKSSILTLRHAAGSLKFLTI